MNKFNLSVVVITKNEEERLKDCLDSVEWADDIIVVDDASTDHTVEIASQSNARVLVRKMDIEGKHRNWAYSQAKNEWVLSLDADERVTPELKDEIIKTLGTENNYNGFTIPRRNYIGNTWVKTNGWYPSPQLKLFRKSKFKYEEVEVHPRAFMDDPCGHLKCDIMHYSYRDLEDFFGKLNKQTTWEAKKWYKAGKPMNLGRFIWRSLDRFCRSYFARGGFKGGILGFSIAYLAALYQWVSFLKYQEILRSERLQPQKTLKS